MYEDTRFLDWFFIFIFLNKIYFFLFLPSNVSTFYLFLLIKISLGLLRVIFCHVNNRVVVHFRFRFNFMINYSTNLFYSTFSFNLLFHYDIYFTLVRKKKYFQQLYSVHQGTIVSFHCLIHIIQCLSIIIPLYNPSMSV